MCRVKAIASSVERLLRYANCSGSSEAGSTEQMCSLTSFSKHLLKMGVRATGLQSFKHVILFFFGMGTMVDFLKHAGTTDRERDRLKISVKTPASWKAHAWYTIWAYGFTDVHPFEGSGYIRDRKRQWTHLVRPGSIDPMTAVVQRVKGFAYYSLSFSRHNKNIKMEHFLLYILSRYFI